MQRLLRGKAFYVVLAIFTAGLFYATGAKLTPQPMPQPPTERLEGLTPELQMAEVKPSQLRAEALRNPRLAFSLGLLGLFMAGMALGGMFLTLTAVVSGRIRAVIRGPFHPVAGWSFGELGRILLVGLFLFVLLPFVRMIVDARWPVLGSDPFLWVTLSMLLLDVLILLVILALAGAKSPRSLGIRWSRFHEAVGVGFRGYMAVFPWLFLLLFLIVGLARRLHLEPPIQPIHQLLFADQTPVVMALTTVLACVVGPIAEEALFRGVVFGLVRRRASRWVAMLISGAVFAAVHTNLIGFIPILLLGCLLADVYERTGNLISPIAVHVLHNTFLLQLAVVFRAVL